MYNSRAWSCSPRRPKGIAWVCASYESRSIWRDGIKQAHWLRKAVFDSAPLLVLLSSNTLGIRLVTQSRTYSHRSSVAQRTSCPIRRSWKLGICSCRLQWYTWRRRSVGFRSANLLFISSWSKLLQNSSRTPTSPTWRSPRNVHVNNWWSALVIVRIVFLPAQPISIKQSAFYHYAK